MRKFSLILSLLLVFGLASCSSESENTNSNVCDDSCEEEIKEKADMSSYEVDLEDNRYIPKSQEDTLKMIQDQKDGIFYFGRPTCPWCVEIVPILNEVAAEKDLYVYYVDTSDKDKTIFPQIEEAFEEMLTNFDDEGNPRMYVPEVIVMIDGKAVDHHIGTLDEHDAHERKMNEDEIAQVKKIYEELLDKATK